jgi:hypothetical protein
MELLLLPMAAIVKFFWLPVAAVEDILVEPEPVEVELVDLLLNQ